MIRFLQKPGPIKKIVLGALLVIVCVMMVVTLVPGGGSLTELFGGGLTTQGVLARVGNQDIGVQEVAQQAHRIAKQQFKGNVPPGLMAYIMPRAAESVIARKMLVYEADRMGLGVSNEELSSALHQGQMGDVLFPGGKFIGEQEYEMLIQSQFDLSVAQFEQEVKGEIAQRKLLSLITAPVSVSDKDVSEEVKKHDTKVKFEYAVLTLDTIKKQINPTDAELKAFYEQYKQQYANSIPEKIKAQYIVIEIAKLTDKVPVTQAELQQYYNQHQDQYRISETVTVRHIWIKAPLPGPNGQVDQKSLDAATAKAEDALKQLRTGANFADVAKKYSEDAATAQKGGLLPPLTRESGVAPEFKQAVLNTPVGQTTGVISTVDGFHVIHVDAKQPAQLKPLDEVKPEIEAVLKGQKASAEAQNLANAVQTLARTAGMGKAAADKGLTVTAAGPVAQGDPLPGVGNAPEFASALFTAKKGDPPATAPLRQGYVIYQVTEIQPPQTPTFEQIKSNVEEQFKQQRAQTQLAQKTQQLADRAHAEHDLDKAAKEAGATVKTSELVDRTSQVPEVGAMSGGASAAFDMKPGEISAPIQGGNSGIVIKVLELQQPSPEQLKQNWDSVKETLLQQKRTEMEQLYLENLRARLEKEGKVKINKKEMESLSRTAEGS
jgi:peptidyl-prolyl cis-trans isomerase D